MTRLAVDKATSAGPAIKIRNATGVVFNDVTVNGKPVQPKSSAIHARSLRSTSPPSTSPAATKGSAATPTNGRTLMFWLNEWTGPPGPDAAWDARLQNIRRHAANLTHVSPCIHALTSAGAFGVQTGGGEQGNYSDIAPHIPALKAMGLKIIPIIYNIGGAGAMVRLHDGAEPGFIKAAVAKAVAEGYDGCVLSASVVLVWCDARAVYQACMVPSMHGDRWVGSCGSPSRLQPLRVAALLASPGTISTTSSAAGRPNRRGPG